MLRDCHINSNCVMHTNTRKNFPETNILRIRESLQIMIIAPNIALKTYNILLAKINRLPRVKESIRRCYILFMITIGNIHLTSTHHRTIFITNSQLLYEAEKKTEQIIDRKCLNVTYINIVITELKQLLVMLFQKLIKVWILKRKRLLIFDNIANGM